jgi:hypothetical protein
VAPKKRRYVSFEQLQFNSASFSSNRVRRNTLTRNPISAESTTLPLLIGIKQRYPSTVSVLIHPFISILS